MLKGVIRGVGGRVKVGVLEGEGDLEEGLLEGGAEFWKEVGVLEELRRGCTCSWLSSFMLLMKFFFQIS